MSVRDEVKEATIRVIAAEGVPAVTIRRVAREVGRSTSAITHYFSTECAPGESLDVRLADAPW